MEQSGRSASLGRPTQTRGVPKAASISVCLWRRAGLLCESFEERTPTPAGSKCIHHSPGSRQERHQILLQVPAARGITPFPCCSQPQAPPQFQRPGLPLCPSLPFGRHPAVLKTAQPSRVWAGFEQCLGRLLQPCRAQAASTQHGLHQAMHTWQQSPSPDHSHPHIALQPEITTASCTLLVSCGRHWLP